MELIADTPPLETPHCEPKPPVGFRINKENASMYSKMAWEARRKRQAALNAAKAFQEQASPEALGLAKEMKRLQGLISETDDADTIAKLSGALERQFKMWQVLSGTPNPGARKAGRTPKPAMVQPEPIIETGSNEPNG